MKRFFQRLVQYKVLFFALSVAWLLFLSALSLIPYEGSELLPETGSEFRWDYLEHFAGYLVLGVLVTLWRLNRNYSLSLLETIFIVGAGLFISFLLEYGQIFIPGRSFNIVDVIYNIFGLTTGVLGAYFIMGRWILDKPVTGD